MTIIPTEEDKTYGKKMGDSIITSLAQLLGTHIGLKGSVGNEQENEPEDVRIVRNTFKTLGRYSGDKDQNGPLLNRPLHENIMAFQKEKELKTDGRIKPGGETETALNLELNRTKDSTGSSNDASTPKPPEKPQNPPPVPSKKPEIQKKEDKEETDQKEENQSKRKEELKELIDDLDGKIEEKETNLDRIEGWVMGIGTAGGALSGGLATLRISKSPIGTGAGAIVGAKNGYDAAEAAIKVLQAEILVLKQNRNKYASELEQLK